MSWDGKMYDKYRIEHADGTPLKGKKYFVLRLDSDDPVEAARVAAAMRAYKSELRNCDVGTAEEQLKRFGNFCRMISKDEICDGCPLFPQCSTLEHCTLAWAQMPYKEGGAK